MIPISIFCQELSGGETGEEAPILVSIVGTDTQMFERFCTFLLPNDALLIEYPAHL